MLAEDNVAYRQTLTKRNLNTLSCKDLNLHTISTHTNNNICNITSKPLIPKIPKPPTAQITLLK